MKVIGITGPTGAGKTTALRAIESLGGVVFDCDRVYGELLETSEELLDAIGQRFPGTVRDGRLDRRALAAVVFKSPGELQALNRITHSRVAAELYGRLERARESGAALAAIDAISLFESGISGFCDDTVFVTAPRETRVRRIMLRDGIDENYAEARVNAQKPDEYFEKRCAHRLVNNFSDSREFFRYCQEFFRRYI